MQLARNVASRMGARAMSTTLPLARPTHTPGLPHVPHIDPSDFHKLVAKLREFFHSKGFLEAHTQNRLSILAACEDPTTIATYTYAGQVWPMPQTGQMWLEYEMLQNPHPEGYFCLSTSYRNEPNPVPGRHDLIFPMFEFEMKGGLKEMLKMERELCSFLGFGPADSFPEITYAEAAAKYGVEELDHGHERQLATDYNRITLLKDFPEHTSPFWNMARNDPPSTSKKCDVIVYGVETIGSAERSCDPAQMEKNFHTISDGGYANILYAQFTKERVLSELNEFLSFNFFPRSGGGIGVTRLISAMKRLEAEKAAGKA